MKNIVELMLKYKQVPVAIVGFIVVFGLLGLLTIQTTNHIPTQIKDVKEDVRRLEDRMDRLEDRMDRLENKMDEGFKEIRKEMNENHRESNENHKALLRYLIERDRAKDKK